MKVVVIGGTGLIGSKLVEKLQMMGTEVIPASPSRGINTLTGFGLDEALQNTDIVVDVSNSPNFEDKAVLEFFETSGKNLLVAEKKAGVKHHIALSVVGTDLLIDSGYFRAKMAQENLIKTSGIPYTILRATQFFDFLASFIQSGTINQTVHLPDAYIQPIAPDDVVSALLRIISETPLNSMLDIAGNERFKFSEIAEKYLEKTNNPFKIVSDSKNRYFGVALKGLELLPQGNFIHGTTNFEKWYERKNP